MIKKPILSLLLIIICFLWAFKKSDKKSTSNSNKPNIVLILVDDLGFSDIGCYGSEIKTPNLDRLAREGMRLKQCYNNAICSPSRASLLTGQYPHKAGIGFFNQDLGFPAYQGYLNKESVTFGEVFKQAGYNTFLLGKWHVGNDSAQLPLQRGFDKFFGFIDGAFSYLDGKPIVKGGKNTETFMSGNQTYSPTNSDFYLTDELTQRSIGFLKDKKNDNPFFLYMAYNAPHWPLQGKPEDIAKYKGKYDIGWDSVRVLRHQKQIEWGVVDKNQKIYKDSTLRAWNKLTFDERHYWVKKMEVYAAMVDNLDQNIGKLLQYLESTNQLNNTLIVFASDNGAEDADIARLPQLIPRLTGTVGSVGSNEAYSRSWAQVSNVPLRSYKATPYEGGNSSPFIARLPKIIPANSLKEGVVHFVDFLPTFISFSGIEYPTKYKNITTNPLAGENFMPLLKGDNWSRTTPICYEWAGHRLIRQGKWKLLSTYPKNDWELYDIENERSETTNIAKENPAKVQELIANYQQWAKQNNVRDWDSDMAKRTGWLGR